MFQDAWPRTSSVTNKLQKYGCVTSEAGSWEMVQLPTFTGLVLELLNLSMLSDQPEAEVTVSKRAFKERT